MATDNAEMVDAQWKETVREIFDAMFFGDVNIFFCKEEETRNMARNVLDIIVKRHSDYF